VAVYEVSLYFPDLPYEEHRRYLASLAAGPRPGLEGFRQHGVGVVLTFVIETDHGIEFAVKDATQRATGLWPNFRPMSTNVQILPAESAPSSRGH
jgi:hypothetical protein